MKPEAWVPLKRDGADNRPVDTLSSCCMYRAPGLAKRGTAPDQSE